MNEEKLEQELRDYFHTEMKTIEPPSNWWDRAISHLPEQKRQSSWFGFVPKTRLAWAFLPLLLLFIGGTVYAASSLVGEIWQKYAGHIEKSGLAQEMDLTQTVNGVTIRLQRAYADSNVILVGFTVSGPAADYLTHGDKLTTVDGQSLPGGGGMGFKPGSTEVMGDWSPTEKVAVIESFDTSSLQGTSSELNLQLVIPVLDWTEPGLNAPVAGVFTFNFNVPLHPGTVIDVNQTVEEAGYTFTLDKVFISPWETRVVIRFNTPLNEEDQPTPIVSLNLPDGKSAHETSGRCVETSYMESFLGDYTGQHGEWTVTISELVFSPDLTQATEIPGHPGALFCTDCPSKRLSGPWVFHFKVP